MSVSADVNNWHPGFFCGLALEAWRRSVPHETTEEEVAFLIEALQIDEGDKLLDAPCGNGRLSLPMALTGFDVTGVDISEEFLQQGRSMAESYGVDIEYINGDLRELAKLVEKNFDAAICMGNSFGYFNPSDTAMFFQQLSTTLRGGARFVLESSMLAESFLVNGSEREWIELGDILMLVENIYDCRRSMVETTYTFIKDTHKEVRKMYHFIFSSGELCRMLEQAGFHVESLYDSVERDDFTLGSRTLILVASKA